MIHFNPVKHRHTRIIIAGTGPSLKPFDVPEGVAVIGVNDAINYMRCDYWFTLDPSPANLALMRNQQSGTYYYAAVPPEFGTIRAVSAAMRERAPDNVHYLHRLTGSGVLSSAFGLPPNNHSINTGNSAYGALQLAYHMGAEKVMLIGVDGHGKYANGVGQPKGRLDHLPELFASLDMGACEVVNASPSSCVECFPKYDLESASTWLTT